MTYDSLRQFADSWALLAMLLFFVGAIAWTLRPGAKSAHTDASMIPFREEENEK